MTHFLSVPLSDEYMEELKDQPTQSDENVMAERLNAAAGKQLILVQCTGIGKQ